MRLRQNKMTGDQFFGCPKFPECRGVRNTDGENTTPPQYMNGSAVRSAPRASAVAPALPLDDLLQEIHRLAVQAHDGTVGQCSGCLKKIIELTRASNFPDEPVNAPSAVRTGVQPSRPGMFRNHVAPAVQDDEEEQPPF